MKLAFAVGTMVAGKRMQLSPRALADLVSGQLQNNPQFKEIGDQLREDLRGVGKAASGALVERQMEGIADRLHGRTAQVRDQLSGVAPDLPGLGADEESDEARDEEGAEESEDGSRREEKSRPRKKTSAKAASGGRSGAGKTAKKTASAGSAAKKSAGKTAGKKTTSPRKTAGRKTTAAKSTAGRGPHRPHIPRRRR